MVEAIYTDPQLQSDQEECTNQEVTSSHSCSDDEEETKDEQDEQDEETSVVKKVKKKKLIKRKKFSINITNARHELPLLHELCDLYKWGKVELKEAKADMIWQFPAHETENNERIFRSAAIFNRLPGSGVGTNKAKSARIFDRMIRHFENDFNFIPRTYLLPNQDREALRVAMHSGKRTFIFKPAGGAEGCGISLAQKFNKIPTHVQN